MQSCQLARRLAFCVIPFMAAADMAGACAGMLTCSSTVAITSEREALICAAVRDALSARLLTQPPPEGLAVTLTITRSEPHAVAGHLGWSTPQGDSGQGATVTLSVIDAPALRPSRFDAFAAALLQSAPLAVP